jgi:ubiquitin-activating enzyme E1 C
MEVTWKKEKDKNVTIRDKNYKIKDGEEIDGDDPAHITWIYQRSLERANQFGIRGVTYRFAQGVVKNIIPAIASTNAIIASSCTNEALKLATLLSKPMEDYMLYNGNEGIYTYTYQNEKNPECPVCGTPQPTVIVVKPDTTVGDWRDSLGEDQRFRLKNPSIRFYEKTIYVPNIKSIEEQTRENLTKKMIDLIPDGTTVSVSDPSVHKGVVFSIVIRYDE